MSNAIRCDGCGTYAARPGEYQSKGTLLPVGWVRLTAYAEARNTETLSDCDGEFCGWPCAHTWFGRYVAARSAS